MEECEAVMSIPPTATAAADIGCEHGSPELCCSKIGIAFFHDNPIDRQIDNTPKNKKTDQAGIHNGVR